MNTLRDTNKLRPELQADLAAYGLMREEARKEAPKHSGKGPDYFGIREDGDDYKLLFTDDITKLDHENERYDIAIVAPDETFDLLTPKDYGKNLSFKNPASLRRFLRKLVDNV